MKIIKKSPFCSLIVLIDMESYSIEDFSIVGSTLCISLYPLTLKIKAVMQVFFLRKDGAVLGLLRKGANIHI